MLILIDRISLRMIASASNHKLMGLVAKWDFPDADALVVDSEIGREWTAMDEAEMKNLYLNMSGQQADAYPGYQQAIDQLRQYAGTWPEYPKSMEHFLALEPKPEPEVQHKGGTNSEGEAIVGEPVATKDEPVGNAADGEDEPIDPKELVKRQRANHQAIITGVEKANAAMTPEQKEAAKAAAPTKPEGEKKASSEPSAPRKPGATKAVWDIADARHAANPGLDIKALRKMIVAECESQGINGGTAATQFGKWKASKGL